jgi:hypothetical protein
MSTPVTSRSSEDSLGNRPTTLVIIISQTNSQLARWATMQSLIQSASKPLPDYPQKPENHAKLRATADQQRHGAIRLSLQRVC